MPDDPIVDAAARFAKDNPLPQGPEVVGPGVVPQTWQFNIIPATRTNSETGEIEEVKLVDAIIFTPLGIIHLINTPSDWGQLIDQLQRHVEMARSGFVIPGDHFDPLGG
jgi:hypothetical protein